MGVVAIRKALREQKPLIETQNLPGQIKIKQNAWIVSICLHVGVVSAFGFYAYQKHNNLPMALPTWETGRVIFMWSFMKMSLDKRFWFGIFKGWK